MKIEEAYKWIDNNFFGDLSEDEMKENLKSMIKRIYKSFEPKNESKEKDSGIKYLSEKFTRAEMKTIGAECIGTVVGSGIVAEFVKYRIAIKKPLKTIRPLKAMIKKLIDADAKGYDIQQILEIMYDNEWQTFELDWIKKKMQSSTQGGADLAQFGFTVDEMNKGFTKIGKVGIDAQELLK